MRGWIVVVGIVSCAHGGPAFRCGERSATVGSPDETVELRCGGDVPVVVRAHTDDDGIEWTARGRVEPAVWERAYRALDQARLGEPAGPIWALRVGAHEQAGGPLPPAAASALSAATEGLPSKPEPSLPAADPDPAWGVPDGGVSTTGTADEPALGGSGGLPDACERYLEAYEQCYAANPQVVHQYEQIRHSWASLAATQKGYDDLQRRCSTVATAACPIH